MKLSIIIPTYNVEKYIKRTINSLIAQTENGFEIVIVDDGSTDNTLKVIDAIIKECNTSNFNTNNWKVIRKTNGGVSSARNEGLRVASGKYILFLDGDDYVATELVENIYKTLENSESKNGENDNSESDIICFGCDIVDENERVIKNYSDTFTLRDENMTGIEALNNMISNKNMWIYTGSAAYRSEFLRSYDLEYTEGCVNGEDQEFTFKALSRAKHVVFIDKSLSYYVQRGTSISNSYNIKRFDAVAALTRTYQYVENIGDNELYIISTKIKNEHIVDNYIYNFDCCLDYIYKTAEFNKECFKNLYDDIEEAYPLSHSKVISSMRNYSGKNHKILFKIKMFLISPAMYIWIFNFKNKLKKLK